MDDKLSLRLFLKDGSKKDIDISLPSDVDVRDINTLLIMIQYNNKIIDIPDAFKQAFDDKESNK